MGIIPSWAIGVCLIIVVVGVAQVVVRRLIGRSGGRGEEIHAEPELARITQALDDLQRRLGEIEERMDFAERVLAKERDWERLAPPKAHDVTPTDQ